MTGLLQSGYLRLNLAILRDLNVTPLHSQGM
jgi:hypothetical protein